MSTLKVNALTNVAGNSDISGVGKVLQVVTSHKADGFATTSSSFVDINGLSRTITPVGASSKIHIVLSLNVGGANSYIAFNLLRGSTVLSTGTNAYGNITGCTFGTYISNGDRTTTNGYNFLDSPSYSVGDTLTYKIQVVSAHNNNEVCINRTSTGANQSYTVNGTSTITLMEVGA
tara:strand:+ start:119 stop:646 length:528 start_codon:yes stop_codon:yes gene_type:complete